MAMRSLVLASMVAFAAGSTYPIEISFEAMSSYIFSEGPMYATGEAPFGAENSMISVHSAVTVEGLLSTGAGALNIVHIDSTNAYAIGYERGPDGDAITKKNLCCDTQMKSANLCEVVGELYLGEGVEGTDLQIKTVQITKSPTVATHEMEVKTTGEQLVAFIYCPVGTAQPGEEFTVDVTGSLTFQNPYGYLSGKSFGFYPFYGIMAAIYLILLIVFFVEVVRHLKVLLWLQYCILGLISVGFIEVCAWFFMYYKLNETGDAVCCPLNQWAVVAVLLNVVKRSVSRMLLIAVCLGFGVVRPELPARTSVLIFLLGASFFGFATYADIRINSDATPKDNDYWTLPVTVLDMIFVVWTYHGLTQVLLELEQLKQTVKLKMYQRLKSVLIVFVGLWMGFAILTILIAKEYVPLEWQSQWLLHSFWHVAYFFILTTASITWRPSSQSQQYAYSFQIPASAEEADAYEMDVTTDTAISDNIEMTATGDGDAFGAPTDEV